MTEKETLRGRRTGADKTRVEQNMVTNFNSLVGDRLDRGFIMAGMKKLI